MTFENVHAAFAPQMSALSYKLAWFPLFFPLKVAAPWTLIIQLGQYDKTSLL